ncbi:MAG: hypothetical protein IJE72_00955 [Clostridia bacterium]|nr:hypothetical protein [Clostridia bacterium]
MKKAITLLLVLMLSAAFSSCATTGGSPSETSEAFEKNTTENHYASEAVSKNSVTETSEISVPETASSTAIPSTEAESSITNDPSKWSKEEIIEFYKAAAKKTSPKAKSKQVMVLEELIINDGDGALGFFIKILEPAIASVIEKNELEFDGITGGFSALTADDAQSIKAYKSGEYTVIEMTMKPQTDPIHADAMSGSVGHAISVLGDISLVLAEFPQFNVDVENANIAIHYVNPTVKVKIDQNGIIEKGTWKYTCDPEISNLDISGIMIDKADAKIDYIITVGGGF